MTINKKIKEEIFFSFEAERERIAEVLIDDIAQLVYAAKLRASIPNQNLYECLALALTKVRNLAYELKPPTLSSFGLLYSIDELVRKKLPGKYIVKTRHVVIIMDDLMQIAIYRVFQTIINHLDIDSIKEFRYDIFKRNGNFFLKMIVNSNNLDPLKSDLKQMIIQSVKPILSLFGGTYSFKVSSGSTTILIILKQL